MVDKIIFICAILTLAAGIAIAAGDDYIKNVEALEASIDTDHRQYPPAAYLYVTLKNGGDRKVSNVTFELKYYDAEGHLVQKTLVKDGLNDPIPRGETRKYRIRLKGNIVDIENAQYPYERSNELDRFDLKITNVKLSFK